MKTRQWPVPPAPGTDPIAETLVEMDIRAITRLDRLIRAAEAEIATCSRLTRRIYLEGRVRAMERRIRKIRQVGEVFGYADGRYPGEAA